MPSTFVNKLNNNQRTNKLLTKCKRKNNNDNEKTNKNNIIKKYSIEKF